MSEMKEMRDCEIDIFNKIKSELTEIFDIGAEKDIDYYNLHPSAKYHLFEPVKPYYDILVEKLKGVDTVEINNFACTNVTGKDMFHLEAGCFNGRPSLKRDIETVEVDTIRLDEYIEENNINTFDFIKIDVEGGEYNVLDGLGIYLHKFKFIQLEYGGCFLDVKVDGENLMLKDIFEILDGYNFIKLETGDTGTAYDTSMEDYHCCNYLFYKPEYHDMVTGG